jgi:hypothetical protein
MVMEPAAEVELELLDELLLLLVDMAEDLVGVLLREGKGTGVEMLVLFT